MKDIKFRVWDKVEQTLFSPETENNNEIFFAGLVNGKLRVSESQYDKGDDFVIMQFTGLHDRKGNEIYIGDIVSIEGETTEGFYRKDLYEVDINPFTQIPVIDSERGQMELFRCFKGCEVVGNIYENPELLETE